MAILHVKSPDGTQTDLDLSTIVTSVNTGSTNGTISVNGTDVAVAGLASGAYAAAYTHPTTSGNKHIPSGGSSGQFLKWSNDGTAVWAADNNTTYSAGTAALLNAGTDTTNRVWTAKILSDFVESKCTPGSSIAANGYVKLDSGLIIQWGMVTDSNSITFPITFPSAIFIVDPGIHNGYSYVTARDITKSGCSIHSQNGEDTISYIAIGK